MQSPVVGAGQLPVGVVEVEVDLHRGQMCLWGKLLLPLLPSIDHAQTGTSHRRLDQLSLRVLGS